MANRINALYTKKNSTEVISVVGVVEKATDTHVVVKLDEPRNGKSYVNCIRKNLQPLSWDVVEA